MSIANILNDEKKLTSQHGCTFDAAARVETELLQTEELGHKAPGGVINLSADINSTKTIAVSQLDVGTLGSSAPPVITLASDMYFNDQYTALGLGGVYCVDNSSSTIIATNLSLYPRSDNVANGIGYHIDVSSGVVPYKWGHSGGLRITNSADPFCTGLIPQQRKMLIEEAFTLPLTNTFNYDIPLTTPRYTEGIDLSGNSIVIPNSIGRSLASFNITLKAQHASASTDKTFFVGIERTRGGVATVIHVSHISATFPTAPSQLTIDCGSVNKLCGFIQDDVTQPLDIIPTDELRFIVNCDTAGATITNAEILCEFKQLF